MAVADHLILLWHGAEIGAFKNPVPDMWYLEGLWQGNHTAHATAFEALAKKLNPRVVYGNLDEGIACFLKYPDGYQTAAIVISLSNENILFIRRIKHS